MEDLEVMDHQIENNVDIQASGREDRQSMDLDEARLPLDLHQSLYGGVEELHMADSQDPIPGRLHEAIGFFESRGEGFLHQDVDSPLEQVAADLTMIDSGYGDYGGLQVPSDLIEAAEDPRTVFHGDALGHTSIDVEDTDQLRARFLGQDAYVVPTQCTGTNDADS